MRRGDLVTVAIAGDFGKPRPALIVQADRFEELASVTVLLLTGTLVDIPLIRLPVAPTAENGLRALSHIMVDKVMTVPWSKVGRRLGRLDDGAMLAVTRSLAFHLGLT